VLQCECNGICSSPFLSLYCPCGRKTTSPPKVDFAISQDLIDVRYMVPSSKQGECPVVTTQGLLTNEYDFNYPIFQFQTMPLGLLWWGPMADSHDDMLAMVERSMASAESALSRRVSKRRCEISSARQ
jgi:hypothetical protein